MMHGPGAFVQITQAPTRKVRPSPSGQHNDGTTGRSINLGRVNRVPGLENLTGPATATVMVDGCRKALLRESISTCRQAHCSSTVVSFIAAFPAMSIADGAGGDLLLAVPCKSSCYGRWEDMVMAADNCDVQRMREAWGIRWQGGQGTGGGRT